MDFKHNKKFLFVVVFMIFIGSMVFAPKQEPEKVLFFPKQTDLAKKQHPTQHRFTK